MMMTMLLCCLCESLICSVPCLHATLTSITCVCSSVWISLYRNRIVPSSTQTYMYIILGIYIHNNFYMSYITTAATTTCSMLLLYIVMKQSTWQYSRNYVHIHIDVQNYMPQCHTATCVCGMYETVCLIYRIYICM